MKYKNFYSQKLDMRILESIDADHKRNLKLLIKEINQGEWTKKQKKTQKSRILPNIALYRSFIDKGYSKNEAQKLVQEYSFHVAAKAHKLLKTFFRIPGFFRLFRFFMKKGMAGDEIWKSKILSNDEKHYSVDVFKCLWADTCGYFKCPELCEIFCLCDHIVFGNIDSLVFERSQTLGMKGKKCDFSFINKRGQNN